MSGDHIQHLGLKSSLFCMICSEYTDTAGTTEAEAETVVQKLFDDIEKSQPNLKKHRYSTRTGGVIIITFKCGSKVTRQPEGCLEWSLTGDAQICPSERQHSDLW